jgi:exodeoxyribonuclease VII small subunit
MNKNIYYLFIYNLQFVGLITLILFKLQTLQTLQTFQTSNPLTFNPMSKAKLTYTEAVTELENILTELENNPEVNMDAISEKVKRAAELMEICKKQLHDLDKDLEKMMENLDN